MQQVQKLVTVTFVQIGTNCISRRVVSLKTELGCAKTSPESPWGSWDTSWGCSHRGHSPSSCSASRTLDPPPLKSQFYMHSKSSQKPLIILHFLPKNRLRIQIYVLLPPIILEWIAECMKPNSTWSWQCGSWAAEVVRLVMYCPSICPNLDCCLKCLWMCQKAISPNPIGAFGSSDSMSLTMQTRKPVVSAEARRTPMPNMDMVKSTLDHFIDSKQQF